MRLLTAFLIIAMGLGCSTSKEIRKQNRAGKKIERIKAEFPQLFRADTSYKNMKFTVDFVLPKTSIHTFVDIPKNDTIIIEKERLRVQIVTERDTVGNISGFDVAAECGGDTVTIEKEVKVPQYIQSIVTKTEYKNKIPWWFWLVLFGLVAWIARGFLIEVYFKYFG
jgi:hypothetical protein